VISGVVYPRNFAVAFNTSYDPSPSLSSISSTVQFGSNSDSKVSIVTFPINNTNRRADQHCPVGFEWRYTKIGAPVAFACNCPANTNCSGSTSCSVVPADRDKWHVVMVPTELCNPGDTQLQIVVMNIPTQ
jgi:hypothetical protein